MMTDLEIVEDLITAWGQAHCGPTHIINFRTVTDEPDANLSDLKIGMQNRSQTVLTECFLSFDNGTDCSPEYRHVYFFSNILSY
jgi:hypothetical protein